MSAPLIDSIKVKGLFGLYSYSLPHDRQFGSASILYGDNGIGKSTILKLVFHLLSAGGNKGHRNSLYKVEFQSLEVKLTSGVTVSATRERDSYLVLQVAHGSEKKASWRYRPGAAVSSEMYIGPDGLPVILGRESGGRVDYKGRRSERGSVPEGEESFLKALEMYAPVMFMLNAERRLDSDEVPDPSDEMELRRLLRQEPKRFNDLAVWSREVALAQALSSAARWIARKAIVGVNQGSTNVHTVYLNVLRHLVTPTASAKTEPVDLPTLQKRFAEIETATVQLAKYELQTELPTVEFRKVLRGRSKAKLQLAAGLLEPYVESLEARIQALTPVYRAVDKFVTLLNGLLTDKQVTFRASLGFRIINKLGQKLEPANLSSGEQQLILLFCYVLIGRDKPTVFMIDEPEISLNVKWQRQLVQSLLDITDGETVQFIFASHSLELLAQHRKSVVRLVNAQ